MKLKMKSKKGFGLIEIVITVAIMSVGLISVLSYLIYSRNTTLKLKRTTEAVSLAEEGIEAVRAIRDESWVTNIANYSAGTTYYPVISGNKWTLSTTNPGELNNFYTRTVIFANVNRDANDNISSSGTNDPNTKKVTVTVSWQETSSEQVQLETYITNFQDN